MLRAAIIGVFSFLLAYGYMLHLNMDYTLESFGLLLGSVVIGVSVGFLTKISVEIVPLL